MADYGKAALSIIGDLFNKILPVKLIDGNLENAKALKVTSADINPVGRGATKIVRVTGNTTSWSLDLEVYKNVRIDIVLVSGTTPTMDLEIKGSPLEESHFIRELDSNAVQTGIAGDRSFVLMNTARYIQLVCTNMSGTPFAFFEIHVTPFN